jgi:hypothetical protein
MTAPTWDLAAVLDRAADGAGSRHWCCEMDTSLGRSCTCEADATILRDLAALVRDYCQIRKAGPPIDAAHDFIMQRYAHEHAIIAFVSTGEKP